MSFSKNICSKPRLAAGVLSLYTIIMLLSLLLSLVLLVLPLVSFSAFFEKDLFFGVKNNSEVKKLQEFLQEQGLYSGPKTGNFLSLTKEAVKKFQIREKVTPPLGYFGSKSRARANSILSVSEISPQLVTEDKKSTLISQIESLQKQISILKAQEERLLAVPPSLITPPPVFTKNPYVFDSGFVNDPPFGATHPYRIILDWSVDKEDVDESVSCTPEPKFLKPASKTTAYFPDHDGDHKCTVSIKDSFGNSSSKDVSFSVPKWINMSGKVLGSFPENEVIVFKVGELSIHNGSSTDVLFANIDTLIIDEMDSTPNRNRKINLILRDGTKVNDTQISKTEFTFILAHPKIGEPHKHPLTLPFDVTLKAGMEKRISLWFEQFKYVKSGTLQIKSTKINMSSPVTSTGGFDFTLTKQPGL